MFSIFCVKEEKTRLKGRLGKWRKKEEVMWKRGKREQKRMLERFEEKREKNESIVKEEKNRLKGLGSGEKKDKLTRRGGKEGRK